MTVSMGSGFIIAVAALAALAAFIGIVYLANWQQNRAFRAARAGHDAPRAGQAAPGQITARQEDHQITYRDET